MNVLGKTKLRKEVCYFVSFPSCLQFFIILRFNPEVKTEIIVMNLPKLLFP